VKYLPLPFYQLNRLRGTDSIFAKVNAVIIGLIFGYVTKNPYVGSAMAMGYLAGESMGWGDWIGQQNGTPLECGNKGEKNGIKWLASKFAACGTENYNKIALVIRGAYWWTPTLLPLMFVMNPATVLLAIIALSFGFQISQDWTGNDGKKSWNDAEYVYGGIQDVVLAVLIGAYYL